VLPEETITEEWEISHKIIQIPLKETKAMEEEKRGRQL
jgi:hypothetical protein